jgi:hypothetical protein
MALRSQKPQHISAYVNNPLGISTTSEDQSHGIDEHGYFKACAEALKSLKRKKYNAQNRHSD